MADKHGHILVVDDNRMNRLKLSRSLEQQGHTIAVAENGRQALEMIKVQSFDLMLLDILMPEIDGYQVLEQMRRDGSLRDIPVIVISALDEIDSVVRCIEMGAEDYLPKPFNPVLLSARIGACLEKKRLRDKEIEQNEQLRIANEKMRADLAAAAKVQMNLLPSSLPEAPAIEFTTRFIPSAFVAGDIYDVFHLDEKHIGFYQADVSGHGVPAALLSVSISQRLSRELRQEYGLFRLPRNEPPCSRLNRPDKVIAQLDDYNMIEKAGMFFTMLYGFVNVESGLVSFCRAGHNLPLVIRASGNAEYIDGGGGALGLALPRGPDERQETQLAPGDRFIVFSDGINESVSATEIGVYYGEERVCELLVAQHSAPLGAAFDTLLADIRAFQGRDDFRDDVSILGFTWLGNTGGPE